MLLTMRYYDGVLRAVAEELDNSPAARVLREWLLSLLPGPSDTEHLGYGPWIRTADQQVWSDTWICGN